MSFALVLLADEVRSKTMKVLEGLDDEMARRRPIGTNNPIVWHAGHAYVVVEWLVGQALGAVPVWPDPRWFELFKWGSQPAATPAEAWPDIDSVRVALREQYTRLRGATLAVTDERLAAPFEVNSKHTNLRQIVHGWHDEACHSGEIRLLRTQFERG